MNKHRSLESGFDSTLFSEVSAAEESAITGGFFRISNFVFSADYNASSGISTPRAATRGQINVFATGTGPARIFHNTQGYVRY